MKTDDLITLLARQAGPAPRHAVARRLAPVLPLGLAASIAGAGWLQGFVPGSLWAQPGPWFKLAYALAMAAMAAWWCARLARPAAPQWAPARGVLLLGAAALAVGLLGWQAAPEAGRLPQLLGHSAARCPWAVAGLALPALGAGLWALRGLAPTHPRRAGFAVGLLAGALGAAGYALA
ncbi:MAG: hypothetical protein RLY78_237, partial [Pseudomonadota bacterium]